MRSILLVPVALIAFAGLPSLIAEDAAPPVPAKKEYKPNTIDPVNGKPVDAAIPAVEVTVGEGDKARHAKIGVSSKESADTISKADDATKKLYIKAAHHDQVVVDGKVVDATPAAK